MSTDRQDNARAIGKRTSERTVSDVAREAFENRMIEGDRPARKPIDKRKGTLQPAENEKN